MTRSFRLHNAVLIPAVLASLTPVAQAAAYSWNGGNYSSSGLPATLSSADTLRITSNLGDPVLDVNLGNAGTIDLATATLYGNGIGLANTGSFRLDVDGNLYATGSNWSFVNSGGFSKTGGSGASTLNGGISFTNNGGAINAASGSIVFANGGSTFNANTTFSGAGTTLVDSAASFNDNFAVASGATLTLQGAAFTGGSNSGAAAGAVLGGVANFNGGQMNGVWTVAAGSTLATRTTDAGGNVIVGGILNNLGTVSVAGTFFGNGATINNGGTFNLTTNDSVYATGANWTFNNNGSLQKTGGGTSVITGGVGFVNNGVAIGIASGSTLQWANGSSTFNGGSAFRDGGTALISSNARFYDAIGVASGTTLTLQGAAFTGGSNSGAAAGAVLGGVANFNGGQMNGVWTVAAGSTLATRTTDAGGNVIVGGILNNLGTVSVAGTFFGNGATINNGGTFNLTTNDSVYATGANWTFNNNGSLQKTGGGTSVITGGVGFVNNGVAIGIASGSTLQWANGSNAFNGGSRFTGGGTALVTSNANFNDAVSVASGTTLNLTGATYTGATTTASTAGAVLTGTANFNGGQFNGTWTVASGGVLNIQPTDAGGNAVIATTTFTNVGRVNVNGNLFGNGATFNNNASGVVALTTDSSLYATGANWTFNNAGTVLKTGTQGATNVTGGIGFANLAGGVVQVNSGAIAFQSGFSNAGTLTFGISGPGSNGAINLGSSTVLGGSFAAVLLAGFTPVVGQTFDVMNFANGYSGTFANTVYTVNGVTFSGVYQSDQFDLKVTSIAAVPEPSTWVMSLVGLLLMSGFMSRYERRHDEA